MTVFVLPTSIASNISNCSLTPRRFFSSASPLRGGRLSVHDHQSPLVVVPTHSQTRNLQTPPQAHMPTLDVEPNGLASRYQKALSNCPGRHWLLTPMLLLS